MSDVDDVVGEILLDKETVKQRVVELGQAISSDYKGKDLVLVCVLKGGIAFLVDLMRQIKVPHEIDFLAISSYGVGQRESTGAVRLLMDLKGDIQGRDVLIVEDIVDSGRTMHYLLRTLWARAPASLKVCSLLSKPSRREVDVSIDYIGFEIPDKFVLGYGLDLDEKYRNLPYVGIMRGKAPPEGA
jgi:hypoxanthine phosphoribosyltransferase